MLLAVVSDSHDNLWAVDAARPHLAQADALIHCGDWISPFTLKRFIEAMEGRPIHGVFGNNDGERRLLGRIADGHDHVHLHGDFAEFTLDGLAIAITHYPEIARGLAHSGRYDLVCYGHDHTAHEERVNGTLLLNPGELFGGLRGRSTLALVDTASRQVTWVEVHPRFGQG